MPMRWLKVMAMGLCAAWALACTAAHARPGTPDCATWRLRYLYSALLCLALAGCNPAEEITPRAYAGMLIADTLPQREQIAQQLLTGAKVSTAGPFGPTPSANGKLGMTFDFGLTTAGGVIVIHSKKHGVTLVQEPIFSNGGVSWRCIVNPTEAKPNPCGYDYQKAELQRTAKPVPSRPEEHLPGQ